MRRIALYVIVLWLWLWLAPITPARAQTVTRVFDFQSAVSVIDAGGRILKRDYYHALYERVEMGGTTYNRLRIGSWGADWSAYLSGVYKSYSRTGETHTVIGRANIFSSNDTIKLVVTPILASNPKRYSVQFSIKDINGNVKVSRTTSTTARTDPDTLFFAAP